MSELCESIVGWLKAMQLGPTLFKLADDTDATIYSSIFALFIFDLFGLTATWDAQIGSRWIDYINSFQDTDTGYFIPPGYKGDLDSKAVHQLTAFSLSALRIVKGEPKHILRFIERWRNRADVKSYLCSKGVLTGAPMSGNFAMFLAIFLTWEYERTGRKGDLIDTWFELHDAWQNSETGFWGKQDKYFPFQGFQNGFHQLVIYNYYHMPVKYQEKIVDAVLGLQDVEGRFAPYAGGSGCYDFDAADILINCGVRTGYRTEEAAAALHTLRKAILDSRNADGGFCESARIRSRYSAIFLDTLRNFCSSPVPVHRFCTTLRSSFNRRINNHWTKIGRKWNQSNIWDTWFRCLTVAEIDTILSDGDKDSGWKFQDFAGLGYFDDDWNRPNKTGIRKLTRRRQS